MSAEFVETSFSRMETERLTDSEENDIDDQEEQSSPVRSRQTANNRPQRTQRNAPADNNDEEEEELKYGLKHVIQIFIPVSVCMLVVVVTVSSIYYYSDQSAGIYLAYTPFHPDSSDKPIQTFLQSLYNSLIILAVIAVMTTILVLLYKYKFYKVIHAWLVLSTCILMFIFSYIYLQEFFKSYNIAFDYISLMIMVFNFGCMGMICLHWKAPLLLQQVYHIIVSALLALVFIKYLPEWTLWAVLAIIAIWDLVAVLCPHGPLRILVNLAHERNENIFPALIYSTTAAYIVTATNDHGDSSEEGTRTTATTNNTAANAATNSTADPVPRSDCRPDRPLRESSAYTNHEDYGVTRAEYSNTGREGAESEQAQRGNRSSANQTGERATAAQNDESNDSGVKLGLGDFIFYSILVGKASSTGDWTTTIAAYIAILMGLFFTLVLLAVFKKALPALPISIAFGLVFNFGTQYVISPFVSFFAANQIYV